MAPLDQVDHFINTVYTDPRFRPPRPESTPVAPGGPSTTQDGDGVPDNLDPDSDGDGIADAEESTGDSWCSRS